MDEAQMVADQERLLAALLDELVELWHTTSQSVPDQLHEFLGMSWEQYQAWAKEPVRWVHEHGMAWFNSCERYAEYGRAKS